MATVSRAEHSGGLFSLPAQSGLEQTLPLMAHRQLCGSVPTASWVGSHRLCLPCKVTAANLPPRVDVLHRSNSRRIQAFSSPASGPSSVRGQPGELPSRWPRPSHSTFSATAAQSLWEGSNAWAWGQVHSLGAGVRDLVPPVVSLLYLLRC